MQRTLERRLRAVDPAQVEDWLAEEHVAHFRRQLDYFCERLAETAPEEVAGYRARLLPLIDEAARRLGVTGDDAAEAAKGSSEMR